jgi:origin recognition complex subunit 5
LYGLEATGKTSVIKAFLEALTALPASTAPNGHSEDSTAEDILQFTIVKCAECITGRHLLEQTVGAVAKAVGWTGTVGRCENLAQFVIELGRLLNDQVPVMRRFVLVFDGIDNQREPQPTLLPALARLGELVCESDSCKAVMILTEV